MDNITTFRYAIGTADQLRDVTEEGLEFQDSAKNLVLQMSGRGVIFVPKFVGVYQGSETMSHTNTAEERSAVEQVNEQNRQHDRIVSILANLTIEERGGIRDKVHPRLIHVVYDPTVCPRDLVRMSIGDEVGRLGYSNKDSFPDFYQKDVNWIDAINSTGNTLSEQGLGRGEILEKIGPSIQVLREDAQKYGLTRSEYAFLGILNHAARFGNSRIITPHSGVDFGDISSILGKLFREY
jgi:hypothetical protein